MPLGYLSDQLFHTHIVNWSDAERDAAFLQNFQLLLTGRAFYYMHDLARKILCSLNLAITPADNDMLLNGKITIG